MAKNRVLLSGELNGSFRGRVEWEKVQKMLGTKEEEIQGRDLNSAAGESSPSPSNAKGFLVSFQRAEEN